MTLLPKKNPHDLTEDEVTFLRSSTVPAEVRGYLVRQHENIGTKISAYRKVAAAARAECEALLAVRMLGEVQGENVTVEKAREEAAIAKRRVCALEVKLAEQDKTILQLTAEPALAIHSR